MELQTGTIIGDRYQIIQTLGIGGVGITYRALDLTTSQQLAVKAVSLRQTGDWKVLELFEREAKVLARLDYDFIPDYLDYFELDTEDDKHFYLVQELVEGKSLADLVDGGWHPTEAEVKDIAQQLLNILIYLHSLTPSVVHRDIKPQNVIRRQDGRVYLVDFGAVGDIYRNTISSGRTFVGTLGYMPLEQLRGEVTTASDLYSLGATLLYIMTHKSPTELPQKGLRIDFERKVNISDRLKLWLAEMLEPIVEDRFSSAQIALGGLQNLAIVRGKVTSPRSLPQDSKIEVVRKSDSLRLKILLGWHYPKNFLPSGAIAIPTALLGLAYLPEITVVLILVWFVYILSLVRQYRNQAPLKIPLESAEKYVALEINADNFRLEKTTRYESEGKANVELQTENTKDLLWVTTIGGEGTDEEVSIAVKDALGTMSRQYSFGKGQINREEARWIAQEISNFIEVDK